MPKFGETSTARLETCHPELQRLFKEVVKTFDCAVLCGYRGAAEQEKAFREGRSKAKFGQSRHNTMIDGKPCSMAVDVAPWPLDWQDVRPFYAFAFYVKAKAECMGIKIRLGCDWDGDYNVKNNHFNDLVHFELI